MDESDYIDENLTSETIDIRPEVLFAAVKMEETFRKNDHKMNWDSCPNSYFINRLDDEYRELRLEVYNSQKAKRIDEDIPITKRIVGETIDVMDFGVMIISRFYGVKCSRGEKKRI